MEDNYYKKCIRDRIKKEEFYYKIELIISIFMVIFVIVLNTLTSEKSNEKIRIKQEEIRQAKEIQEKCQHEYQPTSTSHFVVFRKNISKCTKCGKEF